jgi:hypothetical protein
MVEMSYGIRKGLEDVAHELKGIRNILASMWHGKYQTEETRLLNPESFADEYISNEECARRLGVSDQTLRNWMAMGRADSSKGWIEGVHYVNICPNPNKKAVIRVPWNNLIRSFAKDRPVTAIDLQKSPLLYMTTTEGKLE